MGLKQIDVLGFSIIVAKKDRTVSPVLERFVAKRMNANTFETDSPSCSNAFSTGFCIGCDSKSGEGILKNYY